MGFSFSTRLELGQIAMADVILHFLPVQLGLGPRALGVFSEGVLGVLGGLRSSQGSVQTRRRSARPSSFFWRSNRSRTSVMASCPRSLVKSKPGWRNITMTGAMAPSGKCSARTSLPTMLGAPARGRLRKSYSRLFRLTNENMAKGTIRATLPSKTAPGRRCRNKANRCQEKKPGAGSAADGPA